MNLDELQTILQKQYDAFGLDEDSEATDTIARVLEGIDLVHSFQLQLTPQLKERWIAKLQPFDYLRLINQSINLLKEEGQ